MPSSPAVDTLTLRCPAKINLALRVLHRRDDGFHELDTVFQAIDLWDRMKLRPADDLELECDDPTLPVGPGNLVFRAAERLREELGTPALGARIRLLKGIPHGAGLGGGSSDAAGALLGCARLWGIDPDGETLQRLARGLGADVPFFLTGGTARGRARGDRIEPLPGLPDTPLVVGLPPFGIATSEVFARVADKLTLPGIGVNLPLFLGHKWPKENDFRFAVNDLERVVFEGWPELRTFRDAVRDAGARSALLSGSGSTVYGVFGTPGSARQAAQELAKRFPSWRLLPIRTIAGGVRLDRAT